MPKPDNPGSKGKDKAAEKKTAPHGKSGDKGKGKGAAGAGHRPTGVVLSKVGRNLAFIDRWLNETVKLLDVATVNGVDVTAATDHLNFAIDEVLAAQAELVDAPTPSPDDLEDSTTA